MTQLKLQGLIKGTYNDQEARAYVAAVDNSKEQKNENGDIPNEFIKYLSTTLVPFINRSLEKTEYLVGSEGPNHDMSVVCDDMIPVPFIILNRKDKKAIVDADISKLKLLVETSVKEHNAKTNAMGLFKSQGSTNKAAVKEGKKVAP